MLPNSTWLTLILRQSCPQGSVLPTSTMQVYPISSQWVIPMMYMGFAILVSVNLPTQHVVVSVQVDSVSVYPTHTYLQVQNINDKYKNKNCTLNGKPKPGSQLAKSLGYIRT